MTKTAETVARARSVAEGVNGAYRFNALSVAEGMKSLSLAVMLLADAVDALVRGVKEKQEREEEAR